MVREGTNHGMGLGAAPKSCEAMMRISIHSPQAPEAVVRAFTHHWRD
jgi:hypothetical protein